MDRRERVIDLKREEEFIEEYVSLRNRYSFLLLTRQVKVVETRRWLKRRDIEVRGIVKDSSLTGVTILYLSREGEIAFFVKEPNQGTGRKLLEIIERVAREKNLESVWAWVLDDNLPAKSTFQKNGYTADGKSRRSYRGENRLGVIFRKTFQRDAHHKERS